MNDTTIGYYDLHAEAFVAGTEHADMSACRQRFQRYLEPGDRILDAGCGSGRDVIAFQAAGYAVDAFDASEEICRIASERTGIRVRHLRFEELEGTETYAGIWACASLLHVRPADLPDVLDRLYRLLEPGGVLYASFKYGSGERCREGRYFLDMREETCRQYLEAAGLTVRELFVTGDVREGRGDERWVNAIAQKAVRGHEGAGT
jgi:SAM-dependent methyltransferase